MRITRGAFGAGWDITAAMGEFYAAEDGRVYDVKSQEVIGNYDHRATVEVQHAEIRGVVTQASMALAV